jgi:hypothetical protein
MFTLQTSFKPLLIGGGGGGVKSISRGDSEEQEGRLLRLTSKNPTSVYNSFQLSWPIVDIFLSIGLRLGVIDSSF